MPSADLLTAIEARAPGRWRRHAGLLALLCAAGVVAWMLAPAPARKEWIDAAYAIAGLSPLVPSAADTAPTSSLADARESATGPGERTAARGDDDGGTEGDGSLETPPPAALSARPLTEWLAEIAAAAARGLILAPEVSGEATASFDASTLWTDRLAALSRIHGFHYDVGDRLIEVWVRPREPAPSADDGGDREPHDGEQVLGAAEAPPPPPLEVAALVAAPPDEATRVTEVVRPLHARAEDLVAAIAKAARGSDAQVAADPGSNAVVIAGPEAAVPEIARLVASLDVPRRRFVLEAEIVELSRTARTELGVQWSLEGTVGAIVDFPAADAPGETGGIVVATDGAHALRARITALEADGHVRVVSRPRVVALEGRPASIESVRILRVRFPERTAIVGEAEDPGALDGGRAVEEIPVGITLRVEPSMRGDGRIVLRIRAKSSTLGPPQPPDDIPEELSRSVDAEVAVADGETAVLGGLRREGTSRSGAGVPVLRSIPVLGRLFGRREQEDDDEELVVLVTPRLLPS